MTRNVVLLPAALLVFAADAGARPTQLQEAISPGSSREIVRIEQRCPTFIWSEVESARAYEVVVYALEEGVESGHAEAEPLLLESLPGGALAWTPALDQCLSRGGRYVWFVRAQADMGASEWSQAKLFEVASLPDTGELEQALSILGRYLAEGGNLEDLSVHTKRRSPQTTAASAAEPGTSKRAYPTRARGLGARGQAPGPSGSAAVRGEQSDPGGVTFGVVGTSASPDGSGLAANNTAGGADLTLFGFAGETDALFTQSALDRSSADPETFAITNSGGGGIRLLIDGEPAVVPTTDRDTLGTLGCADKELAKWNGSTWICDADIDTNTDTLAALVCADGQLAKWDGAAWECAPDDDRDTLESLLCASGEIAKWNGTAWVCSRDEDPTFTLGPGLVFDNGQLNLDPAILARFTTTQVYTLDAPGNVGSGTSLAIGADGLGLMSYFDSTNDTVKVAHCADTACSSASISPPILTGPLTSPTSIAVGSDGLGLIAISDIFNLGVAHCLTASCGAVTTLILEAGGRAPSIVIGSDGLGLISYYDAVNGNLKSAHCNDTACASATTSILHTGGDVGQSSSIAIGTDSLGLISYYDSTNGDLTVAHCGDTACSFIFTPATPDTVGDVGQFTSLAIGTDGLGLISYFDSTNSFLKVAHCADTACTSATTSILDSGVSAQGTSIAIGTDGLGLISYVSSSGLKVARCADTACTSAAVAIVDNDISFISSPSIAVGTDGLGLISYAGGPADLRVAHLGIGIP